jgi:hypothetical protein
VTDIRVSFDLGCTNAGNNFFSLAGVQGRTAMNELLYAFIKIMHGTRWNASDGYLAKSAKALTATMEIVSPVSIMYRLSLERMVSVADISVLRRRKA